MTSGEFYPPPLDDQEGVFISFTQRTLSKGEDNLASVRELYTGEIPAWAQRRTRTLGEFIEPRQLYIGWVGDLPHKVAWVDHVGLDNRTGSSYHRHHVVCDCFFYDDKDIFNEKEIMNCSVLQNAILRRADFTAQQMTIDTIIDSFSSTSQGRGIDLFLLQRMIEDILVLDSKHPEEWAGNIISGEHDIALLSMIMRQPVEVVESSVQLLKLEGKVDVEDSTVRLKQAA
jgi:hypothetical protein